MGPGVGKHSCARCQEPEAALKAGEDCSRRQNAHPGGRQFDGQRQTVQLPTDGGQIKVNLNEVQIL